MSWARLELGFIMKDKNNHWARLKLDLRLPSGRVKVGW